MNDSSMIPDHDLPRAAVRPYPSSYVTTWVTRDGTPLTIRPIRPDDEDKMVHFHESLSDRSVYLRYFHQMPLSARVTHARLSHICVVDYDVEMVLVAESESGDIVAVGRLTRERSSPDAEFALLVSDSWHEHGVGTELLERLLEVARQEGIRRVFGEILTENRAMQDVCRRLGFDLRYSVEEGVVKATIEVVSLKS